MPIMLSFIPQVGGGQQVCVGADTICWDCHVSINDGSAPNYYGGCVSQIGQIATCRDLRALGEGGGAPIFTGAQTGL